LEVVVVTLLLLVFSIILVSAGFGFAVGCNFCILWFALICCALARLWMVFSGLFALGVLDVGIDCKFLVGCLISDTDVFELVRVV